MKWNVCAVLLALSAGLSAQGLPTTPKALTVANATVQHAWSLAGYEISIPDPADMETWSIRIRYRHTTSVDGTVLSSDVNAVRISGGAAIAAVLADVDARVEKAIEAETPAPYFSATRDALYAYLQAEGYIDADAQ